MLKWSTAHDANFWLYYILIPKRKEHRKEPSLSLSEQRYLFLFGRTYHPRHGSQSSHNVLSKSSLFLFGITRRPWHGSQSLHNLLELTTTIGETKQKNHFSWFWKCVFPLNLEMCFLIQILCFLYSDNIIKKIRIELVL